MIIYKVHNKLNGKIYIGQTKTNINQRVYEHLKIGGSPLFHKALKKYGVKSFELSIIDISDSIQELKEKEKYWIKFYNCKAPNGYNLTDGGDGIVGYIYSKEVLKKMSESHIGKMIGDNNPARRPEERDRRRRIRKGKTFEQLYGKDKAEKIIKKMSISMKNYDISGDKNPSKQPEVRKKIKEKWKDQEYREKIKQAKSKRRE